MPETKPVPTPEVKPEVSVPIVKIEPKKSKPIRKFFKLFVDVKRWSSYDEVSGNVKTTWGLLQRLLSRGSVGSHQETYEGAIARLGLTEAQLISRKNSFLYSSFVYAAFAVGFFIYCLYLLLHTKLLAASLTLLLVVVMILSFYREHFWYMQMKKKKLGCTFNDWIEFILRRS